MTDKLIKRWQEYLDRAVINASMRELVQETIDRIEELESGKVFAALTFQLADRNRRIKELETVLERIAEYPYDLSADPLAVMNLTGMAREAIAAAEGDDD